MQHDREQERERINRWRVIGWSCFLGGMFLMFMAPNAEGGIKSVMSMTGFLSVIASMYVGFFVGRASTRMKARELAEQARDFWHEGNLNYRKPGEAREESTPAQKTGLPKTGLKDPSNLG